MKIQKLQRQKKIKENKIKKKINKKWILQKKQKTLWPLFMDEVQLPEG